jgi:hypothetical protein
MHALVFLGMIYAACGFVISLLAHVMAVFGNMPGGNGLFFALHIGIFPIFGLVILLFGQNATSSKGWGAFKLILSGCPRWMHYLVYASFIYAFINFALFILQGFVSSQPMQSDGSDPPAMVWRGFSGHWMLFYSVALAGLMTAYNKGPGNLQPKCRLGHVVSFDDKFCPTCGNPIGKS